MKTLFIDCDAETAAAWERVRRPGDPPIELNRDIVAGEALAERLAGYQICIDDHSAFPAPLLKRCADLKHIVFLGTGAGSYIDLAAAARLGIGVSTIKGYGDTAVAEHAVALMMAAARDIATMDRGIRAGSWRTIQGMQLRGKTLGLVGLGGIGAEVARIAAGIGMEVIAWNRSARPASGIAMVPLDEVLARADILSLHLTLNDETHGLLDQDRLAATKRGVILVNTARAAIVDEVALLGLLKSGHIRHAALDVFHEEPLKPDHPLARLPNVTLTAHSGFSTPEAMETLLRRGIDLAKEIIAQGAGR